MSALTAHDHYLSSPATDDPAYSADPESIIDEMVAEPDCFDQWLTGRIPCPSSVAAALSLLLDRGLPRMNKSERDDELRDAYEARLQAARDDFRAWAETPGPMAPSPMETWQEATHV